MQLKNSQNTSILGSLLFFKYKGILTPHDFEMKHEYYGYKCKKYSRWPEIFVSKNSKKILSDVGDSLLDKQIFPVEHYDEISKIWEKVQRWIKDREAFSIEPDITSGYEKLHRLNKLASNMPQLVDSIIVDNEFDLENIDESERWLILCCIQLLELIRNEKRIAFLFENESFETNNTSEFIKITSSLIIKLLKHLALDFDQSSSDKLIFQFMNLLGLASEPNITDRKDKIFKRISPRIFVEKYEGPKTEFVKFIQTEGNLIIKLNKLHKSNDEKNRFHSIFINDDFWITVGESLQSHIGSIEEISSYFDTLGKKIHLYK